MAKLQNELRRIGKESLSKVKPLSPLVDSSEGEYLTNVLDDLDIGDGMTLIPAVSVFSFRGRGKKRMKFKRINL